MAGIVCVACWLIGCGDALVVDVGLGVVVVISGCGLLVLLVVVGIEFGV